MLFYKHFDLPDCIYGYYWIVLLPEKVVIFILSISSI